MPIDPNQPLELDNGQEVELRSNYGSAIVVVYAGSPYRDNRSANSYKQRTGWVYDIVTGVFGGGSSKAYWVLRNADTADSHIPEDWS